MASVALTDAAGTATDITVRPRGWSRTRCGPPSCRLGGLLPSIPQNGSARITFTAGYGPAWSDLPADLAQAVLMLAAHYYEYRAEVALSGGCMPFGVTALIERYRPLRLSGGLA